MKSHELKHFADREGSSAGLEIQALHTGIQNGQSVLTEARMIFVESVLVKGVEKAQPSNSAASQDEGKTLIRDQLNSISSGLDGIDQSMIQPQLYKGVNALLGPSQA